ncbi:MAG: hypothetical protein E6J43_05985 [Chloroflexi bacterium]|nr:MAG: hypothetical protein E6J43_05985 [Chloroflexota bacterium]
MSMRYSSSTRHSGHLHAGAPVLWDVVLVVAYGLRLHAGRPFQAPDQHGNALAQGPGELALQPEPVEHVLTKPEPIVLVLDEGEHRGLGEHAVLHRVQPHPRLALRRFGAALSLISFHRHLIILL